MDDNPYRSPEAHGERLGANWLQWPIKAVLVLGVLAGSIMAVVGAVASLLLIYGLLAYGVSRVIPGLFLFLCVTVLGACIVRVCNRLI